MTIQHTQRGSTVHAQPPGVQAFLDFKQREAECSHDHTTIGVVEGRVWCRCNCGRILETMRKEDVKTYSTFWRSDARRRRSA